MSALVPGDLVRLAEAFRSKGIFAWAVDTMDDTTWHQGGVPSDALDSSSWNGNWPEAQATVTLNGNSTFIIIAISKHWAMVSDGQSLACTFRRVLVPVNTSTDDDKVGACL
jgi:hypothetical protein